MESVGKKYNIIYADPPWQFKVWSNRGMSRSAENHYSTQSLQSLTAFNIPAICENDCVLLMWATFPCLKSALELAEAWGLVIKRSPSPGLSRIKTTKSFSKEWDTIQGQMRKLFFFLPKGNH